jgi:hypothetical protein
VAPKEPVVVEVEVPIPPETWRALRLRSIKTGRAVHEEARRWFEGQPNWRNTIACPNRDYGSWISRDWNGKGYECPNCGATVRPRFKEGR